MISAIILSKNEDQNIERCIKSVKWCDEIIIIDDNSSDKTLEIAKKYKTTVYSHLLNNSFSVQRNFGLSKARNDWILFVDSDETVPDALAYEVSNAITLKDQNLNNFNGFYIKRVDFVWGKKLKYGETGNAWCLRLARKSKGQWKGKVHERWMVEGLIGKLKNPILHFPHDGGIEEFLKEINFYTDIRSEELKSQKTKVFFWDIILYPVGKFLLNYIFRAGFMDGISGLIVSVMMSFHSFLVRSKLWLKTRR